MAGKQLFIFLVEEIMEKGYGKLYYLGQNKNNNLKSDKLKNYYILQKIEEVEDKNFTFIFCKDENAAAITTEGELYTFGNNNENELSHFCYAPKKIENLNDYICDNVSLSDSHMVVIARKKDTGKKPVTAKADPKTKTTTKKEAVNAKKSVKIRCSKTKNIRFRSKILKTFN